MGGLMPIFKAVCKKNNMGQAGKEEAKHSIAYFFEKYGLRPNKRLGQHFLVDKKVILKEIGLARIASNETVLEIGPGLGFLTRELVKKAKKVVAIEKDEKLAEILAIEIPGENLNIICADALDIDFPQFDRCVSNIPYEISSQVIAKLGRCKKPALIILQKEFAERLIAKPKDRIYSRISVLSQYYFDAEMLDAVSKNSFFPAPKVDSAIVRLSPRSDAEKRKFGVNDEDFFFFVVRALFQHKNRAVRNALIHSRGEFKLGKDEMKLISEKMPHRGKKVDALAIKELGEIAVLIKSKLMP